MHYTIIIWTEICTDLSKRISLSKLLLLETDRNTAMIQFIDIEQIIHVR